MESWELWKLSKLADLSGVKSERGFEELKRAYPHGWVKTRHTWVVELAGREA
jgi:hypothetical protein